MQTENNFFKVILKKKLCWSNHSEMVLWEVGEGSDYLGKMLPFSSPPSHWEKTLRHVSHCALTYSLILHTLPFEPAGCRTTQSGMAYIVVHT